VPQPDPETRETERRRATARRLGDGRGPDVLDGRDAGAWRDEAREHFVELALERELEALAAAPRA
jgi:hypothetical protein